MKTNLKLNAMAAKNLSKVEMNQLQGGRACGCGCNYANSGGSSTSANCNANYSGGKGGLYSQSSCCVMELIDGPVLPEVTIRP
jgi:natural product precursor